MLQMFKKLNMFYLFIYFIHHSVTCESLILLPTVRVPHKTKATEVMWLVQFLIRNQKRRFHPLRDICYSITQSR